MKYTLIKFEQENCAPCQRVQAYLDNHEVSVKKVNPFEEPAMAGQFKIATLPTLILIDENGNEVKRSKGFNTIELDELVAMMQ